MAPCLKITPEDLESQAEVQRPRATLKEARQELERIMIAEAMARYKGNLARAAEELGISRPALYELMVRLGIPRNLSRDL
jgi:two-component system NtrC family response regulator